MKKLLTFLLLLIIKPAFTQEFTQTIKGRIVDQQAKSPLIGVSITVENSKPTQGAVSDLNGYYKISNVAIGRVSLKVSSIGYKEQTIQNVLLTTGKEFVLDIDMEEQVTQLAEINVSASSQRNAIEKGLVSVSSKSFNVEDTRRYAGSRNDPARMVAGFAGVTSNNDSRNDIIIRGNSPSGVLWRVEGVDIPNPSHFGALGATGGPVSMLNNNLLAKSSFLTGAFPAMYGNATAGVFDLQLRNGNSDKREFTGQIGFNGVEAGLEGPFSKNSKASYLINYRYSVLDFVKKLGLNFGTGSGVPSYQDLSFKVNIPTSTLGVFNLFGIGGNSNIAFRDEQGDNFYAGSNQNLDYATSMGILGLSNTYFFTPKTSGKLTLLATYSSAKTKVDSLVKQNNTIIGSHLDYNDNSSQSKQVISYTINHKWNAKNSSSVGITYTGFNLHYVDSTFTDNRYKTLHNFQGKTSFLQSYVNWQNRPNERLTINTGIYYQRFMLNNTQSIEPRVGLRYKLDDKQTMSLGLGHHAQLQNLQIYFNNNSSSLTNKNLDMTYSDQVVLGYDRSVNSNVRFKAEAYYQALSNIPVEKTASNYSLLNQGADFGVSDKVNLVNTGTGHNYGTEFTLERNFDKGFYYLTTLSIFDSKYKGSNGIEHNTAFNGNYTFNLLAGKEIKIGKNNTLAFDTKITSAGGRRYTPVNVAASKQNKTIIYYEDRAYDNQSKNYFRADLKITFRQNKRKVMQEWFLDLQNITGSQNVFAQNYKIKGSDVLQTTSYQLGFFPNFNYRIQF
jgi:hypothetical protein